MTSNAKEVSAYIKAIPKQMNYALSQTLNKKGDEATHAIEKHIAANFDITTSWFKAGNKFGGRVKRAKKTKLEATVFMARGGSVAGAGGGTKEHWILDHENGNIRKAMGGNGDILIPTVALMDRLDSTKGKRGRRKVKKFTNKERNNVFEAKIRGNTYLMSQGKKKVIGSRRVKTPTGRWSKVNGKVQQRAFPAFLLKKQVKEPNKLDFYEVVTEVFKSGLQKDFDNFFSKAMASRK